MIPLGVLASSYVAPAGGVTLEYLGVVTDPTGGGTSRTFSDVNFGDAATGRVIVIGVSRFSDFALSSVTIGGVAATIANQAGYNRWASIAYATVPTGSTGSITINAANFPGGCAVAVWRISGAVSVVETKSGDSYSITGDSNGCIVCCGASEKPNGFSWTNATKRSDGEIGYVAYTAADAVADGATNISWNKTAGNRANVAVSFAPA